MVTKRTQPGAVYYPAEDNQVTESAKHAVQYANLLNALRAFFQDRPDVFVGGNNFVYYQEGDPKKCFSPDIFVALGVRPRPIEERGSYRVWEEGVPPRVIIELPSTSTRRVDTVQKPPQYARLGVQEYYLFDPLGEFLKPPLHAYRLNAAGQYDRLPGSEFDSPTLGLRLVVHDGWLRLLNPITSKFLPTLEEAEAEITSLRAELERLKGT